MVFASASLGHGARHAGKQERGRRMMPRPLTKILRGLICKEQLGLIALRSGKTDVTIT